MKRIGLADLSPDRWGTLGAMVILIVIGATLLSLVATAVVLGQREGPKSTSTRVPVDDFAVGDLPMICARTGRPADGLVSTESDPQVFQVWWLLFLFLFPFGLVVIGVLYALAPRSGRIGGSLPMTHEALAAQNRVAGWTWLTWLVPIVALLGGFALVLVPVRSDVLGFDVGIAAGTGMIVLALVGGALAMVGVNAMYRRRTVRVELESGGRWVRLDNVHPAFAAAATKQTRQRHRERNAARERAASEYLED